MHPTTTRDAFPNRFSLIPNRFEPIRNGGRIYNVRRFGRKGRLRVIRATRFLKHFGIEVTGTFVFTNIRYYQDPDTVILSFRDLARS